MFDKGEGWEVASLAGRAGGCGEAVACLLQDARAAGENRALPGGVGGTEHFEKLPLDRPRLLRIGVTMELEPVVGAHGAEDANGVVGAEFLEEERR